MSLEALSAVWKDTRPVKQGQLLVLLAIADFAWDDGWAFPSVKSIAEKARFSIRHCGKILRWLEDHGRITVYEGAGWLGTNLYGLTAVTKGKSNPPIPDEIAAAMRTKVSPRKNAKRVSRGDKMPGGVIKCPPVLDEHKMTAEPYRTIDTHNRETFQPPSGADVLAHAAAYPGNSAKGIGARIPPPWASAWWKWMNDERKFRSSWREDMIWRFEWEWQQGNKYARGEPAAGTGKRVWELTQVLKQLKKQAADHPANEESSAYMSDVTDKDTADYEQLRQKIAAVEKDIARTVL